MRCKENIILKLENLTDYFTEKKKIITLSFIILMLSFANIILCLSNSFSNSVSALSYESNVGIGFSFNPTLSISFSSSNLVISNLAPGTTSDSNDIVVSVSTNASHGYTLAVNTNSDNLVHSNNTNVFNSIATDASIENLTSDNTWGYSYKLSSDTTWSNYAGLSSSTTKTLVNTDNQSPKPIDFKIGAKASTTQASGTYTNTINFMAVSKVAPTSLLDAFIVSGAEQYNGYFKMQDMTSDICNAVDDALIPSELQLIDIRDNKVYWVAKLTDKNCWMTQNLDLDIGGTSVAALTSENTDISTTASGSGIYSSGYTENNGVWIWAPSNRAFTSGGIINYNNNTPSGFSNSFAEPDSAEGGDTYFYSSGNENPDTRYDSLSACIADGHNELTCKHYHTGNYYNYSAAVASNNTNGISTQYTAVANSICPKGWRLPIAVNPEQTIYEFGNLLYSSNISTTRNNDQIAYTDNGFNNIRTAPLWFIRGGIIDANHVYNTGSSGNYITNTILNASTEYMFSFSKQSLNLLDTNATYGSKYIGMPIRCLAR